ncbi:MAG: protein disulfide oxidoreductase [Pseudomonadota bacterium]
MLKRIKTRKFWVTLIRDGLLLMAFFYAVNLYQSRNVTEQIPQQMFDLQAVLISGEPVNIKQSLNKAPLLIYFWGSWCPLCSFTSSAITDLSKQYQVLTIALSSGNQQQVKDYLLENNYNFPVLNDPDGKISQLWGVMATPSIFIINSRGEISSVTIGATTAIALRFKLWLAS